MFVPNAIHAMPCPAIYTNTTCWCADWTKQSFRNVYCPKKVWQLIRFVYGQNRQVNVFTPHGIAKKKALDSMWHACCSTKCSIRRVLMNTNIVGFCFFFFVFWLIFLFTHQLKCCFRWNFRNWLPVPVYNVCL